MTWIVLSLWDLLGLAVALVPAGLVLVYFDKEETAANQHALSKGLPLPRDKLVALKFGLALVVFFITGYVATKMWAISPVIERALR